ncbi:MAG: tetratricopeptide repeat protein [Myxococcota bacterium]
MSTVKTERFLEWQLTPAGKIVGKWPVADQQSPEAYIEIDRDTGGNPVAVREWREGHAEILTRQPTLDDKGRLRYSDFEDPVDGVSGRNCYEYDERGMLCARYELDENGKKRFRTTTRCDTSRRFVEETNFGPTGALRERHVYEYGPGDLLTKDTRYGGADGETLEGHTTLAYDDAGHLIRRTWHGPDGEERSVFTYRYNEHHQAVEWSVERNGQVTVAEVTYDARGKRIATDYRDGSGKQLVLERPAAAGGQWRKSLSDPKDVPEAMERKTEITDERAKVAVNVAYFNFENGNYEEAQSIFEAVASARPNDVYVLSGVGACAVKRGQLQTALNWFERALACDPEHASSLAGQRYVLGALGKAERRE